jgi:hypothetical protein
MSAIVLRRCHCRIQARNSNAQGSVDLRRGPRGRVLANSDHTSERWNAIAKRAESLVFPEDSWGWHSSNGYSNIHRWSWKMAEIPCKTSIFGHFGQNVRKVRSTKRLLVYIRLAVVYSCKRMASPGSSGLLAFLAKEQRQMALPCGPHNRRGVSL